MKTAERVLTEWASDEIKFGFATDSGTLTRLDVRQLAAILSGIDYTPDAATKSVRFILMHLGKRINEARKWIKEMRPDLLPVEPRWLARFESWPEVELAVMS